MMKTRIIGASEKLDTYTVQHALDRSHELVGVCRERCVSKLEAFKGRIPVFPSATNDHQMIQQSIS
jgi:putative NADH-flavin reductase